MNPGKALRGAAVSAALLLLGACGSSSDDTGLLNPSDPGSGASKYIVTLDGPDCVEVGSTATGFTAKLTTASGGLGKNVYVALTATVGDTDAGTIRATKPEGGTTIGGANTSALGVVPFTYTPPTDAIRNPVVVTLTGTAKVDDADAGTAKMLLSLEPGAGPSVRVQGPLAEGSTTVRASSGQVEADPGELVPDFLVTASRTTSSCAGAGPLSGASITVTPTLVGAKARLVDAATLLDGTAAFDYIAPSSVTALTTDTLTVKVTSGASSTTQTFDVVVNPTPPPSTVRVRVSGPTTVSPNVSQAGYTATVESVDAEGTVIASEATKLAITLSDGGAVTLTPNAEGLRGVTDANGKVGFSITPLTSTTANRSIVLTAKVDTTNSSALTAACALATSTCTQTLDLLVQPDVFSFTSPIYGAQGTVGEPNAVPLSFRWATAAGTGVPGCVNLSASFQGSSTSPYLLKINGDPVPATQTRVVKLGSDGGLQVPVSVLSDRSGFVLVTATENRACGASTVTSGTLTASTGVQFVDEICVTTSDGRNCVDLQAPLRTLSSPDASGVQRTVNLTFTVLNNAYQPVDGAQVLFNIVTPANGASTSNERIFPGGGTTSASGVATSQYYVPTFTPALTATDVRTVDVQACVRRFTSTGTDTGALVCSTRRIEIVGPPAS